MEKEISGYPDYGTEIRYKIVRIPQPIASRKFEYSRICVVNSELREMIQKNNATSSFLSCSLRSQVFYLVPQARHPPAVSNTVLFILPLVQINSLRLLQFLSLLRIRFLKVTKSAIGIPDQHLQLPRYDTVADSSKPNSIEISHHFLGMSS